MISFAQINMCGHLTADAKRIGDKGAMACSIAINDAKEHVSYYEVIVGPKTAENIGDMLTKGQPVVIFGRPSIQKRDWEGKTYTDVRVMADNIAIAGKSPDSTARRENASSAPPVNNPPSTNDVNW